MFISWKGRGWVVFLIAAGSLVAVELAVRSYFQDHAYYQREGWPKLAGFWLAAAIVWFLLPVEPVEHFGDPNDVPRPRPSLLRRGDQFFGIPVRFWPYILCVLGFVFYFVRD